MTIMRTIKDQDIIIIDTHTLLLYAGLYTTGRDTLPIGQRIDLSLGAAVDTAKVVLDATVS